MKSVGTISTPDSLVYDLRYAHFASSPVMLNDIRAKAIRN